MIPLFSAQGAAALRKLAAGRPLLAFDFDGTLAPLAAHPEDVRFPERTRLLLERLNALTPVAIVSGRSRAAVLAFFPRPPAFVIGNHGMEGLPSDVAGKDAVGTCTVWKTRLTPLLQGTDAWMEDKTLSFSVHSRDAGFLSRIGATVTENASSLPPLRVLPGKACVNLLPRGAPSKADAVLTLRKLTGCGCVLFVGDDLTDEDVFALEDPRILTVRVGPGPSRAAYALGKQEDVEQLLETLVTLLQGTGHRA
ncbi:MAG: trehalose-phosphatase [Candidatus Peribacteraceae bacterium]|jgi:trehalose 6-phosphate phosphatase